MSLPYNAEVVRPKPKKKWLNGRTRKVTYDEWNAQGRVTSWRPGAPDLEDSADFDKLPEYVGTYESWVEWLKLHKIPNEWSPSLWKYYAKLIWRDKRGRLYESYPQNPVAIDVGPFGPDEHRDEPFGAMHFTRPYSHHEYPPEEVTLRYFQERLADLRNPTVISPPHITAAGWWRASIRVDGNSVTLTSPNGLKWCSMNSQGALSTFRKGDLTLRSPGERRLKERMYFAAINGRDPHLNIVVDLEEAQIDYERKYGRTAPGRGWEVPWGPHPMVSVLTPVMRINQAVFLGTTEARHTIASQNATSDRFKNLDKVHAKTNELRNITTHVVAGEDLDDIPEWYG